MLLPSVACCCMLPVAVACCLLLLHAACSRHMPVYSRLALASVAAARRHLLRRTSANYKLKYFLSVWVLKNCSRFRVFKTCRVFRSFRVFDFSSFRKFPSIVKFSRLFSNRLTLDKDTQKEYIVTYILIYILGPERCTRVPWPLWSETAGVQPDLH